MILISRVTRIKPTAVSQDQPNLVEPQDQKDSATLLKPETKAFENSVKNSSFEWTQGTYLKIKNNNNFQKRFE